MKEINLFDDQAELIDSIRAGMKRFKKNLIVSPTGSGKTVIGSHIIKSATEKGHKVVFSVPRRNLMMQTSKTFDSYGLNHSYLSAGMSHNPYANTFVGTVDTMARRIEKLPKASLVLIDESHFGADALGKVIDHYESIGAWILGFSASPWKLNGKGLGMWYDNLIEGKTVKWLIDNGRLSDYKYFCGRTRPDLSSLKVAGGDYSKHDVADFMEHQGVIIGDCVKDYKNRCMGKIHIVRCASIKHSQMVVEQFNNQGIRAVHVDGDTPDTMLRSIFIAFARREILVVCFCDLLGFGFDLAQITQMDVNIESCSDLKPSKSLAGQLQFWGRVLRMKDYAAVINDHVNNHVEHGFPDDERMWTLEDRIQNKAATEERATPARQCEECYFTHRPAPCCPNCGHVYEVKSRMIDEMDGDLVELDRHSMRASRAVDPVKMEEAIDLMTKNAMKKNPHMPREKAMVWAAQQYTKQLARGR